MSHVEEDVRTELFSFFLLNLNLNSKMVRGREKLKEEKFCRFMRAIIKVKRQIILGVIVL